MALAVTIALALNTTPEMRSPIPKHDLYSVTLLPPAVLPHLVPAHSPDAGIWALVIGVAAGSGAGTVSGWAVADESSTGLGVAIGLSVGVLTALFTTIAMYFLLE